MKRGLVVAFLVGAGGAALFLAFGASQGGSAGPSLPTISNDPVALGDSVLGCQKSDDIERLTQYELQKDNAAWDAALNQLLDSGECRVFSKGSTVYVTDTSAWHNQMKFRAAGDTKEYWGRPVDLAKASS